MERGVFSVKAVPSQSVAQRLFFAFRTHSLLLPSLPLYSISFIIINIIKIYLPQNLLFSTTKYDKTSNSRHVLYEEVCLHFIG